MLVTERTRELCVCFQAHGISLPWNLVEGWKAKKQLMPSRPFKVEPQGSHEIRGPGWLNIPHKAEASKHLYSRWEVQLPEGQSRKDGNQMRQTSAEREGGTGPVQPLQSPDLPLEVGTILTACQAQPLEDHSQGQRSSRVLGEALGSSWK